MSKRDAKAAKDDLANFGHEVERHVRQLEQKLLDAEKTEAESDYESGRYGLDSAPVEPRDGIELDWQSVHVSEPSLSDGR